MILQESKEKRQWPSIEESGLRWENLRTVSLVDHKDKGEVNVLEALLLGKKYQILN